MTVNVCRDIGRLRQRRERTFPAIEMDCKDPRDE